MEILIEHLTHRYAGAESPVLRDVSLRIGAGECVALIGASGSGKSTLLRLIAGLSRAESGTIRVGGHIIQSGGQLAADIRRRRAGIGMVFQQFNLVGRLSLQTNVLAGALHRQPLWRTLSFTLPEPELRARTLLQGAGVILGDEPVSSLDPGSADRVLQAFARINREDGVTCILCLHQIDYARALCPRTIALAGGRVVFDGATSDLTADLLGRIYAHPPDRFVPPAP
jgi:phosphonate transport system ATP-binding protein